MISTLQWLRYIGLFMAAFVYAQEASTQAIAITITKAHRDKVTVTEPSMGRAKCRQTPIITAEQSGKIIAIHITKGQHVKKGQLLAELDPAEPELLKERATTEIDRLQVLIEHSNKQIERLHRMLKQQYASQAELDAMLTERLAYQAQLHDAQAKLKLANHQLIKSKIYAPIHGIIENRFISEGDFASPGQRLFKLTSIKDMFVELPCTEDIAQHLKPGMPILLCTKPHCSNPIKTHIDYIVPIIQEHNRSMHAIATLPQSHTIKPGSSMYGEFIIKNQENVLLIPRKAIIMRPSGTVVYIIQDNISHEHPVTTGIEKGPWREITEGVTEIDVIALEGATFLTDGAHVLVQPTP